MKCRNYAKGCNRDVVEGKKTCQYHLDKEKIYDKKRMKIGTKNGYGSPVYRKKWYEKTVKINDEIIKNAKNKPCADCGRQYHYSAMEFDHCHGKKINRVPKMRAGSTLTLIAEINKCEIVCSNCHHIRSWNRAREKPVA
jgi:hypothetical protein